MSVKERDGENVSIKNSLPPISTSGFLLGAALALAAGALKIVFLGERDEKNEAKETGDETFPPAGNAAAVRG